jgi:hypothetical protein
VGDQPRKCRCEADNLDLWREEPLERSRSPMLDVLGMVAQPGEVFSAKQASDPKPGLMRNREHEIPPADPRQLRDRRCRIVEMLEHFQT